MFKQMNLHLLAGIVSNDPSFWKQSSLHPFCMKTIMKSGGKWMNVVSKSNESASLGTLTP